MIYIMLYKEFLLQMKQYGAQFQLYIYVSYEGRKPCTTFNISKYGNFGTNLKVEKEVYKAVNLQFLMPLYFCSHTKRGVPLNVLDSNFRVYSVPLNAIITFLAADYCVQRTKGVVTKRI